MTGLLGLLIHSIASKLRRRVAARFAVASCCPSCGLACLDCAVCASCLVKAMSQPAVEWWQEQGPTYKLGKELAGGLWIVLAEMVYTWRVMLCDAGSVYGFACYDKDLAMSAYRQWDGTGLPLEGYTRTVNLGGDGERNH